MGNPRSMTIRRPADGENTAMRATLDAGTITHWHTHPRGQLLDALSAKGLARRAGSVVEELRPGDAVWFAAGEKHWHGAGRDRPFSYLSIQANEAGRFVDWHEPVEALS
ncbi:cupin domain-containing protein [Rhizobium sp. LjRoot258]|uniref:cupin domain-containing protein n=1 Tax=Rhizobium sp. LjRoot258 TaxID=3342299 RepID=UPI003ECCBC0F